MTTMHAKTDNEQLVAHLAWDYCEKSRNGKAVDMKEYLRKCPDRKSRVAFKELVNTDLLLDLAVQESRAA